MGWSNYLICPQQKVAFEVSRYVTDKEEDDIYIKALEELREFINSDEYFDMSEIGYKNINLKDFVHAMSWHKKLEELKGMSLDYFLYFYILKNNDKCYIISEHAFYERKKEFKNYKIIHKL